MGEKEFRENYEKGKNKKQDETIEGELRYDIEEEGRNDRDGVDIQERPEGNKKIEGEEKW